MNCLFLICIFRFVIIRFFSLSVCISRITTFRLTFSIITSFVKNFRSHDQILFKLNVNVNTEITNSNKLEKIDFYRWIENQYFHFFHFFSFFFFFASFIHSLISFDVFIFSWNFVCFFSSQNSIAETEKSINFSKRFRRAVLAHAKDLQIDRAQNIMIVVHDNEKSTQH